MIYDNDCLMHFPLSGLWLNQINVQFGEKETVFRDYNMIPITEFSTLFLQSGTSLSSEQTQARLNGNTLFNKP